MSDFLLTPEQRAAYAEFINGTLYLDDLDENGNTVRRPMEEVTFADDDGAPPEDPPLELTADPPLETIRRKLDAHDLWSDEYRQASEELLDLLESRLAQLKEADGEGVAEARDQIEDAVEKVMTFLQTDWSSQEPDEEIEELPPGETTNDFRAALTALTSMFAQPTAAEKAKQAEKQLRVPKGQPGAGTWKDMPGAVAEELAAVLEQLRKSGTDLKGITVRVKKKKSSKPKRMSHAKASKLPPCANEDGPGPCFWDAAKQGNGKGTSFVIDENGNHKEVAKPRKSHLVKATPEMIKQLEAKYGVKIPPGWTDIKVNLNGKGLIASGKGPDGKRQQLYTKEAAAKQAANKLKRLKKAAAAETALKQAIQKVNGNNALAAIRLLYTSGMKAGEALSLDGSSMRKTSDGGYELKASSGGKDITYTIKDPELVKYLNGRRDKDSLFREDTEQPLTEETLNAKLAEITGDDVNAADLRLLRANHIAAALVLTIADSAKELTVEQYEEHQLSVAEQVATQLGISGEQALSSYISPVVFAPLVERISNDEQS